MSLRTTHMHTSSTSPLLITPTCQTYNSPRSIIPGTRQSPSNTAYTYIYPTWKNEKAHVARSPYLHADRAKGRYIIITSSLSLPLRGNRVRPARLCSARVAHRESNALVARAPPSPTHIVCAPVCIALFFILFLPHGDYAQSLRHLNNSRWRLCNCAL